MTDKELDRAVSDALGIQLDPGFDFDAHEWGEPEMCFRSYDIGWGDTASCCGDRQTCARCDANRCSRSDCNEDDPAPKRCVRPPRAPRNYSGDVGEAMDALRLLASAHGFQRWTIEGAPRTRYGVNIVCLGVTFRGEADCASEAICRAIVAAVRREA